MVFKGFDKHAPPPSIILIYAYLSCPFPYFSISLVGGPNFSYPLPFTSIIFVSKPLHYPPLISPSTSVIVTISLSLTSFTLWHVLTPPTQTNKHLQENILSIQEYWDAQLTNLEGWWNQKNNGQSTSNSFSLVVSEFIYVV